MEPGSNCSPNPDGRHRSGDSGDFYVVGAKNNINVRPRNIKIRVVVKNK